MKTWPFPPYFLSEGGGVCFVVSFHVGGIKKVVARGAASAEEWATAALVLAKTLNFHWLEAWPEAFFFLAGGSGGLSSLDHRPESDSRLT